MVFKLWYLKGDLFFGGTIMKVFRFGLFLLIGLSFGYLAFAGTCDQDLDCPKFQTLACKSKLAYSDAQAILVNLNNRQVDVTVTQTKPNIYANHYTADAVYSGNFWTFRAQASDGSYFSLLEDNDGMGNFEAGYRNHNHPQNGPISLPQVGGGSINCVETP